MLFYNIIVPRHLKRSDVESFLDVFGSYSIRDEESGIVLTAPEVVWTVEGQKVPFEVYFFDAEYYYTDEALTKVREILATQEASVIQVAPLSTQDVGFRRFPVEGAQHFQGIVDAGTVLITKFVNGEPAERDEFIRFFDSPVG